MRLKGQGMAGMNGGEPGDALIKLHVHPDKTFRREGNDIHCDLAISLSEAILGGSIEVPIIDGKVNMKLPANANSGTKLRLRGKGAPYDRGNKRGDQSYLQSDDCGPGSAVGQEQEKSRQMPAFEMMFSASCRDAFLTIPG